MVMLTSGNSRSYWTMAMLPFGLWNQEEMHLMFGTYFASRTLAARAFKYAEKFFYMCDWSWASEIPLRIYLAICTSAYKAYL